ncbi:patatin-like phospholipase family protein [Flavobacterium gelidilacus]|jgi:NTE family protein|uniref:patatin-like phospholipase family protein n=1 Tax=Flavobacterium gelidilacus TaxID=206041 RepID=UPI000407FA81|nr:patatin-like phospholipase family protein [Flavobacterium gelidilacus]
MDFSSKSIGLVLSGGGSKGIAQAGALKFLEEQNIKPSHIAGTSAGAIIAALYAYGKKPEEILEFFKSIYFFHWKHFTFKKAGIVDSDSFKSYFNTIFKDTTIGELAMPTFITATDLVKGKLKVFRPETKITDAVLASSSFPGMLSPYELNGKLYSDGGILNHFPSDLLQGRCDYIIGVYVSPIQTIEAKDLRSIKSVTTRAFDLLSAQGNYQKFNLCDWVIEPKELANFSTFETNKLKMDKIFDIGYQAAKASFENLNL